MKRIICLVLLVIGPIFITALLMMLAACCNPVKMEHHTLGPLWIRNIHYDMVTVETESGYISRWNMCDSEAVWQGMHATIEFYKDVNHLPGCWRANINHLPPDLPITR